MSEHIVNGTGTAPEIYSPRVLTLLLQRTSELKSPTRRFANEPSKGAASFPQA